MFPRKGFNEERKLMKRISYGGKKKSRQNIDPQGRPHSHGWYFHTCCPFILLHYSKFIETKELFRLNNRLNQLYTVKIISTISAMTVG